MKSSASLLLLASTCVQSSLVVYDTPQSPRPYVLPKGYGLQQAQPDGSAFIYAVTGNSSANAFTLLITNGAATGNASVFPHVHKKTHEMFYASKGRVQLWAQTADGFNNNNTVQQSRTLFQGDIGSVSPGAIHSFRLDDPDTTLTGVLVPGGFEKLFFTAAANPAIFGNTTALAELDVYPYYNYTLRNDLVNGETGTDPWHTGPNDIPSTAVPYFVAKGFGPKYMASSNGVHQIIQPLVNSASSAGRFGQGTVTISPKPAAAKVPTAVKYATSTAFQMEEGSLVVTVGGNSATLIQGDVFFAPNNTAFSYFATSDFTKFLYVAQGSTGFDSVLLSQATPYNSSLLPNDTNGTTLGKREFHKNSMMVPGGFMRI